MLKKYLSKTRTSNIKVKNKTKIINTILIFILEIALGIFSKWLNNLSIDNTIWWQNIIDILDLKNVFSLFGIWIFIAVAISVFSSTPKRASLNVFLFFIGLTVSYHLYTILFSGINPASYMMIWYAITLLSPLLAYVCWYAIGDGKLPLIVNILILSAMSLSSFSIGVWYFDINSIIDLLLFTGTVLILYKIPKRTIYSLIFSLILSFVIRIII